MGKKLFIAAGIVAAAGLGVLLLRASDGYDLMGKASVALLSYGASLAISTDCEHWATAADSREAFAQKTLIPSPTKFNFAKMDIGGAEEVLIALDASPRDLLMMEGKQQIWVTERGGQIINMGTQGNLDIAPAPGHDATSAGPSSAIELIVAQGRNKVSRVSLMNDQGEVYLIQFGHDGAFLTCGEKHGCHFGRMTGKPGKVTDPQEESALKKGWDRAAMSGVGTACKSLADAGTGAALDRFDAIDGTCHGKVNTKLLKSTRDGRIADCATYAEKITPVAEAFFSKP